MKLATQLAPADPTQPETSHIQQVEELMQEDRRWTCEHQELSEHFDISTMSVHRILTQDLQMRKVAARWVPHHLSPEQRQERVRIATLIQNRLRREPDFLNRVVAVDKAWIRSYEPELKRQSSEWRRPGSPRPIKFRQKFLKKFEAGYKRKKASVFTKEQIMKFLSDAPDDGEYVHMKAGIVIAYFGGLRCADLVALNCEDLEFNETTGMWVTYTVSKQRGESIKNKFNIPLEFCSYLEKYDHALDLCNVDSGRRRVE